MKTDILHTSECMTHLSHMHKNFFLKEKDWLVGVYLKNDKNLSIFWKSCKLLRRNYKRIFLFYLLVCENFLSNTGNTWNHKRGKEAQCKFDNS